MSWRRRRRSPAGATGTRPATSRWPLASSEAGANGAAENVLVNLPALGDPATAAALEGRVAELLAEVEGLAESTRAYVEAGEPRDPEPESTG